MWFTTRIPRRKVGRALADVSRFVPWLESLEERTVLSTLTVTNNLDSGAGSLRATITNAKSGDTLIFAPSLNGQTITLTSDQLEINKNLDIEGPGASLLSISGNEANRVFDISGGLTVAIDGLTITQGLGKGDIQGKNSGGGGGGAILNGGSTVNLASDVFSSNRALNHGGAITNGPGSVLTVISSTFVSNQAMGQVGAAYIEGGAIWNTDNGGVGASAAIIGCTFISNQALGAAGGSISGPGAVLGETSGGAIHNEGPDFLTVKNSTFIGNQAIAGNDGDGSQASGSYRVDWAQGGAVANDGGQHFVADGCTFSYNEAIAGSNLIGNSRGSGRIGHAEGGAVDSQGVATITNSTFDHNEALGGNNNTGGSSVVLNGRAAGGAIGSFQFFSTPAILTVSNCTFTDNQAIGGRGNTGGLIVGTGVGGAIANDRGGTATVTGSTFTGNQAIGGAGAVGQNGADGLGGGIANVLGSTLTVNCCMLTGNQGIGGTGGAGGNGGNGLGGGLYNDGLSIWPANAGTPATLTVTGTTITDNQATGGAGVSGGSAGQGIGGGTYFTAGGSVCLDAFTQANIKKNQASTSNDDVFGTFTIC